MVKLMSVYLYCVLFIRLMWLFGWMFVVIRLSVICCILVVNCVVVMFCYWFCMWWLNRMCFGFFVVCLIISELMLLVVGLVISVGMENLVIGCFFVMG